MKSNRLSVLAGDVAGAVKRYERASAEAVDAYLEAGRLLAEAKEAADHGEWLPFLEAAGVKARTAQRMMRLSGSGLTCATVAHLGGVGATDRFLAWCEAKRLDDAYQAWFYNCPMLASDESPESLFDGHHETVRERLSADDVQSRFVDSAYGIPLGGVMAWN